MQKTHTHYATQYTLSYHSVRWIYFALVLHGDLPHMSALGSTLLSELPFFLFFTVFSTIAAWWCVFPIVCVRVWMRAYWVCFRFGCI